MLKHSNQAYPYAKALFDLAKAKQTLLEWSALLQRVSVIADDKQTQLLFNNPKITAEQLAEFFIQIVDAQSEEEKNFIQLLAEYNRLNLMPHIAFLFEQFVAEYKNILKAQVTSAYPLDEKCQQDLVQALKKYFRRDICLTYSTDQNLMGGLVIRVGDLVMDSSIRGKLIRLKRHLY